MGSQIHFCYKTNYLYLYDGVFHFQRNEQFNFLHLILILGFWGVARSSLIKSPLFVQLFAFIKFELKIIAV